MMGPLSGTHGTGGAGGADPTGTSDIELMLAVKVGDERAFEVLVERHSDRILNYLFRWVGQREEAENLTQEVFWRLFQSAKRYEPTAKFTTFLYTIAMNAARSAHRGLEKKAVHRSWDQPAGSPRFAGVAGREGRALSEVVANPSASPWKRVLTGERRAIIDGALDRLPPELKDVFLLSEEEDLSYAEIADLLKIPIGTVGSRKYNAVRMLREALAPLREELLGEAL